MIKIFKNKKQRTVILLLLWCLIIGTLYGFLYYENAKYAKIREEYEAKNNFKIDYDYVKESILNNDFDYLYIVVDNDIISYKGHKENNKYSGIVNENNIKTEYSNKDLLNKKYPYLTLDKVFSLDFDKGNNTFLYENNDLYVKIRVSIDNKINIEINDKDIIYQLEISNIKDFDVKGSE